MTNQIHLTNVSINEPQIILADELKKILLETRLNRDAIMLAHNDVNILQDKYNKFIIVLSLFSAFFESIKGQLDLAERKDFLSPLSILMPILLTTVLGIVSSMMKFKKFPERMELLTKSTEKCNVTILKIRKLQESLNFQPPEVSYTFYIEDVMMFYRDSLDCYEKALYPNEHSKYLEMARRILKEMKKKTNNFEKPKNWYDCFFNCCKNENSFNENYSNKKQQVLSKENKSLSLPYDEDIESDNTEKQEENENKNNDKKDDDSFQINFGAFPREEEDEEEEEEENSKKNQIVSIKV